MCGRVGALVLVALVTACGSRSGLFDPGSPAAGTGGTSTGGAGSGGVATGGTPATGGAGGASGGAGGAAGMGGGGAGGCQYSDVVVGGYHTCALSPGGVLCCGANQFGQLGSGQPGSDATIPTPIAGPSDFIALGAGQYHSSGIRAGGGMMAWGHNPLGVLGDGTTVDQAVPSVVKGPGDAVGLSQGMVLSHACAVHGGGSVTCWGDNAKGALGDGSFTSSTTQKQVVGLEDSVSVAVGYIFSCAVQWNGVVRCWGWNASGALGIGNLDAQSYATPTTVVGVSDAVQVVAGNHYGCARTAGGAVYCWGYNGSGQLGIGSNVEHSPKATPVAGLTDAIWLSGGNSHVCAVRKSGSVSCWGRNYFGQLGDGTSVDADAPVTVVGIVDASKVAAGGEHSCALSASQGLLCWGANESGQLGNGTSDKSPYPTKVGCPLSACGGADPAFVKSHFLPCPDGKHVGQVASAPGVTCQAVCCVFGYAGCAHRAAQAGFDACVPASPPASGACSDVFQDQWSSQCACE